MMLIYTDHESECRHAGQGPTFAAAASVLLDALVNAYENPPNEIFEAFTHFAEGNPEPFERRDFSTPEENFTMERRAD